MYPVTTEFQTKITDPKNRRVFPKIQIDYTDINLDESIVVSANEEANVSYPEQIADNVRQPVGKILSLDGSCSFDGTYVFAPTDDEEYLKQMGWWGDTLAGVGGVFSVPYPTVTMEFNSRPILRITVIGDDARDEYPKDFNVYLYDETDTLVYTHNVTNNTEIQYVENLDPVVTDVAKMVLEITKWSHANRQVKIYELYTAIRETYEWEEVISLDLLEEREVSGTGLPIGSISNNELTIKLDNSSRKFDAGNTASPLYELVKPNRRVQAWLGIQKDDLDFEYVPLGTFWTDDWDVPEHQAYATTTALDRLKFLENTTYVADTVLINPTLYDLALDVLEDYGLTASEYYIDPVLDDIVIPYFYLPDGLNHREMLAKIAEASLGYVYCDRDNVIRIEGMFPTAETYSISVNEENTVSCKDQLANGVTECESFYIMLDGLSSFDGSYELPEDDCSEEIGWIGTSISGVDGSFSSPYPTVTMTFQEKSIATVVVAGDNLRNEYPVDFNVKIYDDVDALLSSQSITANTELVKTITIPENPTTAVKIVVEILKWSQAGTAVKILEIKDDVYRLSITTDEYFRKNNPAKYNELANVISVNYIPMDNLGEQSDAVKVEVFDETSISVNGVKRFEMNDNLLIQTEALALSIATVLISNYADPQRHLELEWRGNPALLLGDSILVTDDKETNEYRVYGQTLNYAGVLRSKLNARKVVK
jgi:hypothetical protein